MGNPHKADAHFLCKIFFKKLLTNAADGAIMAGGARSLPAVRRRNFNYTTRQHFCQALFHCQFAQRFSQNLYFTNKKSFAIIYLQGKGRKKTKNSRKKIKKSIDK
jgi:hypothetical protein